MPPRVVFDTSVLFSAIGWGGTPGQCVETASQGRSHAITCTEILAELEEKLARKLAFSDERVAAVLASLIAMSEVIAITGQLRGPQQDRKDDMILECAVVGQATHIVTGDRKHLLPLGEFQGVRIVTPAEFLAHTQSEPGAR